MLWRTANAECWSFSPPLRSSWRVGWWRWWRCSTSSYAGPLTPPCHKTLDRWITNIFYVACDVISSQHWNCACFFENIPLPYLSLNLFWVSVDRTGLLSSSFICPLSSPILLCPYDFHKLWIFSDTVDIATDKSGWIFWWMWMKKSFCYAVLTKLH